MRVPVAVRQVRLRTTVSVYFTLLYIYNMLLTSASVFVFKLKITVQYLLVKWLLLIQCRHVPLCVVYPTLYHMTEKPCTWSSLHIYEMKKY